jgi:hypothetical protein
VWKVEDEQTLIRAWEECLRLKERMFWARCGASFVHQMQSARFVPDSELSSRTSSPTEQVDISPPEDDTVTNVDEENELNEQSVAYINEEDDDEDDEVIEVAYNVKEV